MEYLSEIEKARIETFYKDEVLREAVKKVLLQEININGVLRAGVKADPTKNGALSLAFSTINGGSKLSNEELGEDLRALAQGVRSVEMGFKKLGEIHSQPVPSTDPEVNPGL